ncbi:MAG: hypothetical protein CVT92_09780 [Bacteroidetes bacterium HGW-Bacteroidetes-1]|jgi:hypothetical protein|nr:MAG: hypothetical protein CVT92_09780 [Bacteroidetes bacterium HGW-Bacteroidetes-1]
MNKTINGTLACIFLAFSFGCHTSQNTVKTIPEPLTEDHASADYNFDKGIYYTYVFEEGANFGFDEKALISKILTTGSDVKDIWYKSGASMCVPPGSNMGMTVMVDPSLLIRLDKSDTELMNLGFIETTEPGLGDCAYYVKRYRF